jgi:ComF family protein
VPSTSPCLSQNNKARGQRPEAHGRRPAALGARLRAGPTASLQRALDGLAAVALAAECAACGLPLDRPFAGPVCQACWAAIRQGPLPGFPLPPLITQSSSAGFYEGALRAIIHAFKYDRRQTLAVPLAALLTDQCQEVLAGADACVPVPLHWQRRWERGFNQAQELAQGLSLPVWHALARRRRTRPQALQHKGTRQANVAGAFVVRRWTRVSRPRHRWGFVRSGPLLRCATIVLIDDVMTTGATLQACATALKEAGVRDVRAATIARAVVRAE